MVSGTKQPALLATLTFLAAMPAIAPAASLLPNGDFESGSLLGWFGAGIDGGIADIATAGTCFSGEDTTRLTMFGGHAALIRSGPGGGRGSIGALTSDPFVAGDGIVFAALTGTRDGERVVAPVHFEVRILNADGAPLTAQRFNTAVVRLADGCPGEARDGRFYVHYFDTRAFRDQQIRIQFRQGTNTGGFEPFTLIDQVIVFGRGEGPLFTSKPEAVAALSSTRRGVPRLDASHSFDPDGGPAPLTFSWQIDGENLIRLGEKPCLADLADGTYEATLFVNDGFHAVSDRLRFEITGQSIGGDGQGDNDDSGDGNGETEAVPRVEYDGCGEDTLATEFSIDQGTPAGGGGDNDDSGGAGSGGDPAAGMSGGGVDNSAPTVDLDADDSSVSGNNFQATYVIGGDPVAIADTDVAVGDADGDEIASATITLQYGADGDSLDIDPSLLPAGIAAAVSPTSINLSGVAAPEAYAAAIGAITFETSDPGDGSRFITVTVNDGIDDSGFAFASIIVQE